jgi:hypothetical protein
MLGIGFQGEVARRIETVDGRDQAQDASGHQIIHLDIDGEARVDPAGNQLYLRKVFQDQTLALLGRREFCGLGCGVHFSVAPRADKGNLVPKPVEKVE